jgi:anti-sigma factor RsiW
MSHDPNPLHRFAGRDLTGAEAAELERLLDARPDRRDEWARLQRLTGALQAARTDAFQAPVRAQVMAQIQGERASTADALAATLQAMFVRIEVAALAAIAGLCIHNLAAVDGAYAASWIERLLGVPGTTLETLLLFGTM